MRNVCSRLAKLLGKQPGDSEYTKRRRPVEGYDANQTTSEKRIGLPGTDVGDDEPADDEKHIHAADPESKREVKPRTRGDVEVHHEKRGDHTQKMHVVKHECSRSSSEWRMWSDLDWVSTRGEW